MPAEASKANHDKLTKLNGEDDDGDDDDLPVHTNTNSARVKRHCLPSS